MNNNYENIATSIRKDMKEKRTQLFADIKKYSLYSSLAQENVINSQTWQNSTDIALYIPFRGEVDTKILIDTASKENKNIYFPRCYDPKIEKGKMDFIKVDSTSFENTFTSGAYGIIEPKKDLQATKLPEQTLIILPCLAYNQEGYRLGYGGGYYDRLLEVNLSNNGYYTPLVLAFSFQENTFNPNTWDIPAHFIANEKELLCTL